MVMVECGGGAFLEVVVEVAAAAGRDVGMMRGEFNL